ncbi:MAG: ATP-binding protein [Gammaproteobacteria bacterium]|nr:ATP-binding protein [Gammaproteobacteria bacterium]
MRIAISGTHYMGKSTLIEDFIAKHPNYRCEDEPYDKLLYEQSMELALEPSLEGMLEELDYSIDRLNECENEANVIFDRCPVDFIAYAMCALQKDFIDINDSEVADRFDEIKEALNHLDLIIFLPITKDYHIEYPEENPEYRLAADRFFKKLYREDICDIFPRYNHPRIIELSRDRETRVKSLESYLTNY